MTIRVLLVEDSPVVLLILKRILEAEPDIEVTGTARTGREGLELLPSANPHVICTDLQMPEMDGLTFTREVMARFPRPILAIGSSLRGEDSHDAFRALEAGAVDVFPKPETGYEGIRRALVEKIRILAGVAVFTIRHRSSELYPHEPRAPEGKVSQKIRSQKIPQKIPQKISQKIPGIVAIGASTGGPKALNAILSRLPANFPVPALCVQHISQGFLQGLVDWLDRSCPLKVRQAHAGEIPLPGYVYFPAEGTHLNVSDRGCLQLSRQPAADGHCPSITHTFESVARFYGSGGIGVLLTGMGRDGAIGLQAIARAGGITVAQDRASCVIFGMPASAIELGAARYVLPLGKIADFLLERAIVR